MEFIYRTFIFFFFKKGGFQENLTAKVFGKGNRKKLI